MDNRGRSLEASILAVILVAPQGAAAAQTPPLTASSPSPSPTPVATPTPTPTITLSGVGLAMETFTAGVNATGNLANQNGADQPNRFNISSAFLTVTRNTG